MNILYFPGYGGGEMSNMYQAIKAQYPDAQVIRYDNFQAELAKEQIQHQMETLGWEKILLVGQSLGGFWAHRFAVQTNNPVLLINPSLFPHKSLGKYGLSESQLQSYENHVENGMVKKKCIVILSKDDEVVDPSPVLEKYSGIAQFFEIEGGHQVRNYEQLFEAIRLMQEDEEWSGLR